MTNRMDSQNLAEQIVSGIYDYLDEYLTDNDYKDMTNLIVAIIEKSK